LTIALCSLSFGQDDFFNDIEISTSNNNLDSSSPFSILGWVSQKISYGFEEPGELFSRSDRELNKLETSLFTQLDWQPSSGINLRFSGKAYHDEIYQFNDDTSYSQAERNEFRNRFEVRDFYLEKQISDNVYLKAGNQILAWGFAEHLRVTDIINTEDQYTFGQQDLEDLRLQVPATLLSVSLNDWVFDGVVTYRAGYNDMAPAGDEFDQFIAYRQSGGIVDRKSPDNPFEYFFRASTHFDNGDLQLVAGEFNNNQLSLNGISRSQSLIPIFQLSQERIQALGIAANRANGSWLLFGEMGMHFNNPVTPSVDETFLLLNGWNEKDQLLGVLGVEYNGFYNTVISLEADSIQTRDYSDSLLVDKNQHSFGTRIYWTGWNDRLELLSVFNKLADSQGYVTRVSMEYDWTDSLNFGLLWVDYSAEETSNYYNYRNNDMVQFNLRFSFQN
jgi:hypothetical protein